MSPHTENHIRHVPLLEHEHSQARNSLIDHSIGQLVFFVRVDIKVAALSRWRRGLEGVPWTSHARRVRNTFRSMLTDEEDEVELNPAKENP